MQHNRATPVVTNNIFDQTSLPLVSQQLFLTVKETIDFETTWIEYEALHGYALPYIKSMLQKLSDSCNAKPLIRS